MCPAHFTFGAMEMSSQMSHWSAIAVLSIGAIVLANPGDRLGATSGEHGRLRARTTELRDRQESAKAAAGRFESLLHEGNLVEWQKALENAGYLTPAEVTELFFAEVRLNEIEGR